MKQKVASRNIKILVAKLGLDGHDRGALVLCRAFRDAGMEVVYTGLRQTADMIVRTALQEDVDVIGISILSGAHNMVFPKILAKMRSEGINDVLLTGGGIIPDTDTEELNKLGVAQLFAPGTKTADIISYIEEWVEKHRKQTHV